MISDRSLIINWLEEVKDLPPGDCLYVPCDSKHRQKALLKGFKRELILLGEINPIAASQITISEAFQKGLHWITLLKSAIDPTVAFRKDGNGNYSKITLTKESMPARIRKQMIEAGVLNENENENRS